MEARVARLERDLGHTRERVAKLETLTPAIRELRSSVEDLTAALNKGKGAIWIVGGLGIFAGSISTWLLNLFWRR